MRWGGSAGKGDLQMGSALNLGLENDPGCLSHIGMCIAGCAHSLFLECGGKAISTIYS